MKRCLVHPDHDCTCAAWEARKDKEIEQLRADLMEFRNAAADEMARLQADKARLRADLTEFWNTAANEIERLQAVERAARLLIADVRGRHPEQELYCPFMRALDTAIAKMEGK